MQESVNGQNGQDETHLQRARLFTERGVTTKQGLRINAKVSGNAVGGIQRLNRIGNELVGGTQPLISVRVQNRGKAAITQYGQTAQVNGSGWFNLSICGRSLHRNVSLSHRRKVPNGRVSRLCGSDRGDSPPAEE